MATSLQVISQSDFSGGMWPSPSPERIPANGVYDATNALVDDTGGLYARGGSVPTNTAGPNAQVLWIWEGTLTGGLRRLAATATNLYSVSGSTWTNLGAYTGMATGANRPSVLNGVMYLPPSTGNTVTYDGTTVGTLATGTFFYTTSVANRLLFGGGSFPSQVSFSGVGTTTFGATDFWRIPSGVVITGLAALRDAAIVFTDKGTWVISNMALNLTDAAGNLQQRLDLYSPDMVLWGTGSASVVGYEGGLIVPARDGVWLMRLGTASEAATPLQLLSRPITALYQSYVRSGNRPGQAAIFNGHYFLPILNSSLVPVDLLVCRLNIPSTPWTHFSFTAPPAAFILSADGLSLLSAPKIISSQAEIDIAKYFPSSIFNPFDSDVFAVNMAITSRDYLTGPLNTNTVVKAKLGYRTVGTDSRGAISAAFGSTDAVGTTATALTGTAPPTNGALSAFSWPVGKRGRGARFKLTATVFNAVSLESLETFVRSQGRQ